MKKIIFIVLVFLSLNCKSQFLPLGGTHANFIQVNDSLNYYMRKCDSLKSALFLAQYKIEQIKFYLNIVEKRPSQKKFEHGWIKRAIK